MGTRFRARSATPIVLPLAGDVNGFNSGLYTGHPLAFPVALGAARVTPRRACPDPLPCLASPG
jgi:hypothetical protein